MSLLERFLSESHLRAIAAMLLHSLWQGVLLAAVAGAVLLLTKRSAATIRYNILVALLFLFAAGAAYTYTSYLHGEESLSTTVIQSDHSPASYVENQAVFPGSVFSATVHLFNSNAPLIVFCWLLVIFFRLCFLISGYQTVRRFASKHLHAPPQEWSDRWTELNTLMRMQVPVRLMESAIAKVPMVIGHLRPLVLVPAGMLLSLPPQQAESILLHELAHIRRHDYLMNMLQQAIECIFFFHPAVWWVCSLISEEREHCCDDMVTSRNGDKRTYINALVSFYETTLPSATVVSFRGRKYNVMDRIKRLINHRNKTLNIMEKIFLTAGLIVVGFLVHAYQNTNTSPDRHITYTITDTLPNGSNELNMTENGKNYRLILSNDQISELYVDGKKIPPERFSEYRAILNRMRKEKQEAEEDALRARADAENAKRDAENARQHAEKVEQAAEDAEQDVEAGKQQDQSAREQARKQSDSKRKDQERSVDADRDSNDDDADNEASISGAEIQNIVRDAMKQAEKALQDLRTDGSMDTEIREEVRKAMKDAQRELRDARQELKGALKEKHDAHQEINEPEHEIDLAALTNEVVELALKAAHLGLQEANAELAASLDEPHTKKMNRKEYKERKKQLREEYKK